MRFLSRNTNAGPTASSNKVSDQHKTIAESGLFDADWYLTTYPDVAAAGLDPIDHYLNHGASEGRNPGPGFDTIWYLSENHYVRAAGVNPLLHYIQYGRHSETAPVPLNEGQRFESFSRAVRSGMLNGAALFDRIEEVRFALAPPEPRGPDGSLPLPPLALSQRIGSPTLEGFDSIGLEAKTTIMRCLPKDFSFKGARCLDFGCGIGRVMRHFAAEAEVCEFWGCDIDGTSMLWGNENLAPPFRFFQLSDAPIVPLESNSFDFVYALGVFSAVFQDWSALAMEIRRILKPGGLFFMSFNGQTSFEELLRRSYYDLFRDSGLFLSHPFRAWNKGGPAVAMSPEWIKTHWGAMFDIDYIAMEGFMDYMSFCMMRKPPFGAPRRSEAPVLALGTSQAFNPEAVGAIAPRFDATRPFRESYGIEGSGAIDVGGWIVFKKDRPESLSVAIDGEEVAAPATFTSRDNDYFAWGAPQVDFKCRVDLSGMSKGAHELCVTAQSRGGARHRMTMPLTVR
jgi:ubiquinone/menaquinone biosynthesis C-methylase UbiE